ncbi:ArsA family ATPase [Nocardioides insulae]|uniref:ArsA family ATPase n=1 Tax=Nocardioides insulae TaxID=394734 RepID=UPI0003F55A6D|nr:TRC40/GET3/ArsA family transport-energizing ATPase [Nocardioides insulae]
MTSHALRVAAQRRVLFVGGKGGVGKTSLASALALARARQGARVLLVSTDPAHNLGHLWDRTVGDSAVRLAICPGDVRAGQAESVGGYVDGLEIDPQRTVDRHLAAVGVTMRRLLPERMRGAAERHLALAREAPGTHESAVLERIAEAVETGTRDYDLVLFDTAPSGHTVRLMALPEQLTVWTETLLANRDRSDRFGEALQGLGGSASRGGGRADRRTSERHAELRQVLERRQQRFARLRDVVGDHELTAFLIVLTAERLPVAESLDLHEQLSGLGVDVGALVVNRRSPSGAGEVLAARREQEDTQLALLRARLPGVLLDEVPLLPGELVGDVALSGLAAELTGAGRAG